MEDKPFQTIKHIRNYSNEYILAPDKKDKGLKEKDQLPKMNMLNIYSIKFYCKKM